MQSLPNFFCTCSAIVIAIIPVGSFLLSIQFVKETYGALQEISKLRAGSGDEN